MKNNLIRIANAIKEHDNFIITAHHNPDGDALGSMCAMAYMLQALDKTYCLYNISGLSHYLRNIPLPSPLYTELTELPKDFTPESIIVLDVSDPRRIGDELYTLLPSLYSINIDHHASCSPFAHENFIDASYASTGCILAELAEHYGLQLSQNLGECLYLSLTEDTGNFRNPNTDARSLHVASSILDNGLSVGDFVQKYQNQWSLSKMILWGHLLSSCQLYYDEQLVISAVSLNLLKEYHATPEDIDGVNSFLMHIDSVRIAITLREVKENSHYGVKASLRSYDVNLLPLARHFGGGGHEKACGIFFPQQRLEEVNTLLIDAIAHFALL